LQRFGSASSFFYVRFTETATLTVGRGLAPAAYPTCHPERRAITPHPPLTRSPFPHRGRFSPPCHPERSVAKSNPKGDAKHRDLLHWCLHPCTQRELDDDDSSSSFFLSRSYLIWALAIFIILIIIYTLHFCQFGSRKSKNLQINFFKKVIDNFFRVWYN
jgi:hypothetical protein